MTTVTVLGTGNMGTAISTLLTQGDNSVQVLGSADSGTPVTGDVVVLAVPHTALAEIVATRGASLAGKVVVDITNPVDFSTFDSLVVPADGSATAQLAASLPQSHVLKAFNTNFAATLAAGAVGDQTTTVLVAGDDTEAKATLVDLVTAAGLKAVDAGTLRRARELEALGFLQLTLAASEKINWTGGFAVIA
ncbi:diguanylate cyclase [Nakamurella silvestris]|nr:diguanylate cyclase [Nakamurella silvestris]